MCLEDDGNDTEEMLLLFRTEYFKYRMFRVGLNFLFQWVLFNSGPSMML